MIRYLDICSGISAPTQAWAPLGWTCAGYAEVAKFPRSVLQQRYGAVAVDGDHRWRKGQSFTPLFDDFTTIEARHVGPIDLLVGGTPCQSFSLAGLRGGLDDDRGNLALEFFRLAQRTRPKWLVWENVPGVLSSRGGRDFGSILAAMGECGYGLAYRVLDAQYVRVQRFSRAVPQRRRRVFVVGYLGDWRRAAAVLFEREGLQGHPAPRREAGQGPGPTLSARPSGGGGLGTDFECDGGLIPQVARPRDRGDMNVSHTLRGAGHDASEDGTGRGVPLVAFDCKGSQVQTTTDGAAAPLRAMGHDKSHSNAGGHAAIALQERADAAGGGPDGKGWRDDGAAYTMEARTRPQAVAFQNRVRGDDGRGYCRSPQASPDVAGTLDATKPWNVALPWAVRRLTPRECERLQGFPDDFTAIDWRGKAAAACPDGPLYKALGNSMAVNVMTWIGERIAAVEGVAV